MWKGVPYDGCSRAPPKNDVIEWMTSRRPPASPRTRGSPPYEIKPAIPAVTHHICSRFNAAHARCRRTSLFVWDDKQRDEGVEVPPANGNSLSRQPMAKASSCRLALVTTLRRGLQGLTTATITWPEDRLHLLSAGNARSPITGRSMQLSWSRRASDMNWTLHYTPNGTAVTDTPEIGLTVAKSRTDSIMSRSRASAPYGSGRFAIPPNDRQLAPAASEATFQSRCRAGVDDAPYARSRQGYDLQAGFSGRQKEVALERAAL